MTRLIRAATSAWWSPLCGSGSGGKTVSRKCAPASRSTRAGNTSQSKRSASEARAESYVGDNIHQARLPCMRLCAGQSGITLDILHVERRAADHSANIGSKGNLGIRFQLLVRACFQEKACQIQTTSAPAFERGLYNKSLHGLSGHALIHFGCAPVSFPLHCSPRLRNHDNRGCPRTPRLKL